LSTGETRGASGANFLRRLPQGERMGRGLRLGLWAGGGGVLLYALLLGDGGWLRVASLQAEVRELEAELDALNRGQIEVGDQLRALEEPGSPVLEEVAREVYGMHRDGERVVHILGAGDETLAPTAPDLDPGPDRNAPPPENGGS